MREEAHPQSQSTLSCFPLRYQIVLCFGFDLGLTFRKSLCFWRYNLSPSVTCRRMQLAGLPTHGLAGSSLASRHTVPFTTSIRRGSYSHRANAPTKSAARPEANEAVPGEALRRCLVATSLVLATMCSTHLATAIEVKKPDTYEVHNIWSLR